MRSMEKASLASRGTKHGVQIVVRGADTQITVPAGFAAPAPIVLSKFTDHTTHNIIVTAGAGASVTIVTTVPANMKQVTIVQRGTVEKNASVHWFNMTMGQETEQSLVSQISGANARSTIDWIFLASGDNQQKINARNVFTEENGGGEITIKGVAEEKAHVACSGMIEIGPKGRGTQTYLTENVLMLDPTARVDAIPGLEIKTNDVKASHSATVSRVTPEDLFYFASRGIAEGDARKMFIEGFLFDLVERIVDSDERDHMSRIIRQRLS